MSRGGRRRNPLRVAILSERESPVVRLLLDNGLALVLCPRPHLSQAYLAFYCGVGSRHESLADNGITHVLEHMLFRGTHSFKDATALNLAAEEFGGFLEGATYRDHLLFATAAHPDAVGEAIAILAELVQRPRYRAMEVERAILKEELLETLDADGRMIDLDNITHRLVFGAGGLGLPIEGHLKNIARFKVADLEAHRRRYLVGTNSVLSIAGPIDVHALLPKIRRAFGRLPAGNPPLVEAPSAPAPRPILRYVRDAASQVDIRLCFRGVAVDDPEYPALVLLARVLADGLGSRMHAELVDRRGLAYALHAGLTTYGDCGLFDFEVSVAPDRAAEAVAAILGFAAAAGRFRFGDSELRRVRRRYRYGIEFMRDSPPDLASWYGRSTLFGIEQQMDHLGGRIEKLGEREIRHAARRVFRRPGLVVAAVGELVRGEWKRVDRVVQRWRGFRAD
ncbi:MAG: insulinase family protein [Deltaproteobacteria bacterium]|nr:insulinase family protein [Deltaproteobacteria bacterium]